MNRQSIGIFLSACLLSPLCMAADSDKPEKTEKPPAAHGHRGAKKIVLENGDGAVITLWNPDLSTQPLTLEHNSVTVPVTGVNNYHAVVAEKAWSGHKETVIRYEYMFGRPSHQSPARLAAAEKSEFEIVPDPIPREHYRYHSQQNWGFLVRLHGKPLANQPLTLETSHGTLQTLSSNAEGRVEFRIPDDFPDLVEGERDKRLAQFTISSEYRDEGITYTTQLNADYRINPSHWQSTRLGLLVLGIGLLTGSYLGRAKKTKGDKA